MPVTACQSRNKAFAAFGTAKCVGKLWRIYAQIESWRNRPIEREFLNAVQTGLVFFRSFRTQPILRENFPHSHRSLPAPIRYTLRRSSFASATSLNFFNDEVSLQDRSMNKPKEIVAIFAWVSLATFTSGHCYIDHLPHRDEVNSVFSFVSRSFYQFPEKMLD
jgi:hypothetical protein